MTQHFITNIECNIDGGTATVRAMFYNPMLFPGATSCRSAVAGTNTTWCGQRTAAQPPFSIEHNSWFVNPPA